MRIIHTADLHLGTTTYGNEDPSTGLNRRIYDFFAAFDQCVDYTIQNEADALLMCGDTFKDISPSSTLLKMFASRLRRLTSREICVLMVLGNHDSPKAIGRSAPLEIFDELRLPCVHVFSKPGFVDIRSHDGLKARMFILPYRHPIHIAGNARKPRVELSGNELLASYQDEIKSNIETFAREGKGDAQVGILAAHLMVEGSRRGAERIYIAGAEFTIPQKVLQSESFDFVALGHVHSHQVLASAIPMVYSGSLEKIDFSEAEENKGFIDIRYENEKLSWRFVSVRTRPMIRLDVDCTKIEDMTEAVIRSAKEREMKDAIVKLVLKVKPGTHVDLDQVHETLSLAFWRQVSYDRAEEKPVVDATSWRSLNPHETLARYLDTTDLSQEEITLLKRLGNEIVEEVVSEADKG